MPLTPFALIMPVQTKVLFLLPYPLGSAPSQRFRVENFLPLLDDSGIAWDTASFMDDATRRIFYKPGNIHLKLFGILKGLCRRVRHVWQARRYNWIFIHREAAPLGPPVFEWVLTKVLGKRVIFDFDDAIWMPDSSRNGLLSRILKWHSKTGSICRWASKVSGGNDYLCNYARQQGAKTVIRIPTVVDTKRRYNRIKHHHAGQLIIGWTGSYSTLVYLNSLVPFLQILEQKIDFEFLVIADRDPKLPLKRQRFIKWNELSEVDDLLNIDIGVMPLPDDSWAKGKCGFKIIQYLSVGIPAVASPVGVNSVIIENEINGFLCDGVDWVNCLKILAEDVELRSKLGLKGREKIVNFYSLDSQYQPFLSLFNM
jgi:glycosyltransferase involved in cell wall biosynthesis